MPERGLGLRADEIHIVVDLEQRLGAVGDAPHHDGADLDRVADEIVDLQLGALMVADALLYLGGAEQRKMCLWNLTAT